MSIENTYKYLNNDIFGEWHELLSCHESILSSHSIKPHSLHDIITYKKQDYKETKLLEVA